MTCLFPSPDQDDRRYDEDGNFKEIFFRDPENHGIPGFDWPYDEKQSQYAIHEVALALLTGVITREFADYLAAFSAFDQEIIISAPTMKDMEREARRMYRMRRSRKRKRKMAN